MRALIPLLILVQIFCLPGPAMAADGFDLDSLLQGISSNSAGTVRYAEQRYTRLRKQPVESRGELQFNPPDILIRRIEFPEPAEFIVDGDQLREVRGEEVVSRQLADSQNLLGFIEAVRATLAGDRTRLEQFYTPQLHGDTNEWQLELVPRDKKLARVVETILISGSGNRIGRIDIADTRGGSTQTVLFHPSAGPSQK